MSFIFRRQDGLFWKGSYSKRKRDDSQRVRNRPLTKVMSYMAQGSSKACIVCPSTFQFLCMWLGIFQLQKLMQFKFRGRFIFEYK